MSFKTCVKRTNHLAGAYCIGLEALSGVDRDRIRIADPRKLKGSVNVDSALRVPYPNAARWDYGIGYASGAEVVYWVEVHPASGGASVGEIQNKLEWLLRWLSEEAREFQALKRDIVWIASGRCAFTQTSPQLRKFASQGLRFVGQSLRIP